MGARKKKRIKQPKDNTVADPRSVHVSLVNFVSKKRVGFATASLGVKNAEKLGCFPVQRVGSRGGEKRRTRPVFILLPLLPVLFVEGYILGYVEGYVSFPAYFVVSL